MCLVSTSAAKVRRFCFQAFIIIFDIVKKLENSAEMMRLLERA